MSATVEQEFAVVISALQAGRIDGRQAVASLVALHGRMFEPAPLIASREALAKALGDALAWDWEAEPGVPSVAEVCGDLADALLASDALQTPAEFAADIASRLPDVTEGKDRAGTERWSNRERDAYSLAIEEAQAAIRALAERPTS